MKLNRKWPCTALWIPILAAAQPASSPPERPKLDVSWWVANRFPLLDDTAFESLADRWSISKPIARFVFAGKGEAGDAYPARFLLADPKLANRDGTQGGWIPVGQAVQVVMSVTGASRCSWVYPAVPKPDSPANNCVGVAAVLEDHDARFVAQTDVGDVNVDVRPQSFVVAAMGDSFASGEGSPDGPAVYPNRDTPPDSRWVFEPDRWKEELAGEPAVWWDDVCHRSMLSWPVLSSLRLAFERRHHVVHLADVSCSGAEFFDGIFLAQSKPNVPSGNPGISHERDGAGPRYTGPVGGPDDQFVPLSQIDALREMLCASAHTREPLDLPNFEYKTAWRDCDPKPRQPDLLLLSIGGNDIKFGPAVTGVLIPDHTHEHNFAVSWAYKLGLSVTRSAADAVSLDYLINQAKRLTPFYPTYLIKVMEGALSPKATILLKYPNPVGTDLDTCAGDRRAIRFRNSFMTLGKSMEQLSPAILGWYYADWTAELSNRELRNFVDDAYKSIRDLQATLPSPIAAAEWIPDGSDAFKNQLLCEESDPMDRTDEPYLFCQALKGGRDECVSVGSGGRTYEEEHRKSKLTDWKYQSPNRRFVNSLNDSYLAQRRWTSARPTPPSRQDIRDAMSGSFHPTPKAHAVAADSVFAQMCELIKPSPGEDSCNAALPAAPLASSH